MVKGGPLYHWQLRHALPRIGFTVRTPKSVERAFAGRRLLPKAIDYPTAMLKVDELLRQHGVDK